MNLGSKLASILSLGSASASAGSVIYLQSAKIIDPSIQREILNLQIEKKIEDDIKKVTKTEQLTSSGKFEENYGFAKLITNFNSYKQLGYDKYPKNNNEYDDRIKKIGDDNEDEKTFTKSEFRELIKKLIKNTEEYPAAMLLSLISLQFPDNSENTDLRNGEYIYLTSEQLPTAQKHKLDIHKFKTEDHSKIKVNEELNMKSDIDKQDLDKLVDVWFKNWNNLEEEGEFYAYEKLLPIEKVKKINKDMIGSVITIYKQYKNKTYYLDLVLRGKGFGELRTINNRKSYLNVSYKEGRSLGLCIWTMHIASSMKEFATGNNSDLSKSYFGETNVSSDMRNFERWTEVEYKLQQTPNTKSKTRKKKSVTKSDPSIEQNRPISTKSNHIQSKQSKNPLPKSKNQQSSQISSAILSSIENFLIGVKTKLRT